MDPENILYESKGTIVVVGTPVEFSRCSVKGAVNIPLREIKNRLDEIRTLKPPLLLCSASGRKNEQAREIIAGTGIECYIAGSCNDLELFYPQML